MNDMSQGLARFEFTERIRYSECDHNCALTLPALIELFQDCSIFHSEEIGFGPKRLKDAARAWVLTHWHIVINRNPELGEEITIGTFPSSFKTVSATRNFYLRDKDGNILAKANSTWGFIDLETGKPVRPSQEHVSAYGILDPLPMPKEKRHVAVPDTLVSADPIVVHRDLIDTNEHVNNSQYVRLALGVLPTEIEVKQARVDFKRSAVLGDTIFPKYALELASVSESDTKPERAVVVLADSQDKLFGVVEFCPRIGEA